MLAFKANAQTINSISGNVTNTKNELLVGNAVVLSVIDSSFVKGVQFVDGKFEISDIHKEEVILKLTSLEFEDTFINVKYEGNSFVNLGTLQVQVQSNQLEEVKIEARKPIVVQKTDGTIEVKIGNTILSSSNSINEILSKTPGVISDESGVSVFGKGQAIIYLNGRLITNEQFASIPVAQIDKIEIISNPSAKYEAQGRAVINIITKKNNDLGYTGTIKQNTSYSDFAKGFISFTSTDLSYKKGKFSFLGNYALQMGKDRERLKTTRTRNESGDFFNSELSTYWNRDLKNYSNYGAGLQYDFNNKTYISAEYKGFFEKLGGNQISNNEIDLNATKGFYFSDVNLDTRVFNNSISVNFNSILDDLGSSLFIGSQYSDFKNNTNNLIFEKREENVISTNILKNLNNIGVNLTNVQIDYSKIFKNKNVLEIGTRISKVGNSSVLNFFTSTNGQDFTPVDLLSNDFKYNEVISAGYINFKGKLNNKINFSTGLRTENTDYLLAINSVGNAQKFEKNYWNFFPSASFTIKVSDEINLNTSYSSRISRVPFRNLNPNLIYQDPFTSVQGNPDLIPEKVHSFEINTKYKTYSFKMGYDYTLDPIDGAALRGKDPKSYILKRMNLKNSNNYFATFSKSFSNNWLSSTNNVSVNYTEQKDDFFNYQIIAPRPQIYLYSNNTFKIPNLINIELLAWYYGEKYSGLRYERSRYNITIAMEKSFLNKSVKTRLLANDIFGGIVLSGNYNVGETEIYYNRIFNNSFIRLELSYNFGKLTKVTYKNKATGETENNRAR